VASGPGTESQLAVQAQTLDALIELLLCARPGEPRGWLSITFDDGYADAASYVASRAATFRDVDFILFVCPEKILRRAGFRWDLLETSVRRGVTPEAAKALFDAPLDPVLENARPELLALGDAPGLELATAEALRALAEVPNVAIGNHTNLHALSRAQPFELIREDFRRSTALLEQLLGSAPRHFAFPFGTPGEAFDVRHVTAVRALGYARIWTTEARASRPAQHVQGALLPRCPIVGLRSVESLAGWLVAKVLNQGIRGELSIAERP
jgi:peptidoglycan/xylan/chitin deacetylase (PgdA/CDA1 family)